MSYAAHSLGESYPSAEKQSLSSAAPADWATGHSLGESYLSAEMQSVYSATPADWTTNIRGKMYEYYFSSSSYD